MNLESQVTSLELSQKLLTLGVKQNSLFVWISIIKTGFNFVKFREDFEPNSENVGAYNYPAFTSSELLSMLPTGITLPTGEPFNSFRLRIEKFLYVKEEVKHLSTIQAVEAYSVNYRCDSTECAGENAWLEITLFDLNIWDENPSNAFAKTLIYLIENGYVKNE